MLTLGVVLYQTSSRLVPGNFYLWQTMAELFSITMTHRMMSAYLLQSSLEERVELVDYMQRDEHAFCDDTHAILLRDAVMEQIETISRARADQRLKEIQTAPKKQMLPRLVHLRQSFPAGTSSKRAHEIANRIQKIGMVEKQRQFVYVFEQTGMTNDELGKNFHMQRFYAEGKNTDISPGKVAKEVWRITKLDKNSAHIVFHDNIHKLTSYHTVQLCVLSVMPCNQCLPNCHAPDIHPTCLPRSAAPPCLPPPPMPCPKL